MLKRLSILVATLALAAFAAGAAPLEVVAVAPGYPGDTEQAQPSMDALARAVESAAGLEPGSVRFTYYETASGGLERLGAGGVDAVMVTLPFFHGNAQAMGFAPVLEAVQEAGDYDTWNLVAMNGKVTGPASLSGWVVAGVPGYAPAFVREVALGSWGRLPDDVEIRFTPRILTEVRRAAKGEPVAVLLDRFQTKSLERLSLARDLEVVATSVEMPASVFCWVGDGGGDGDGEDEDEDATRRAAIERALVTLAEREDGREALAGAQLRRFERLADSDAKWLSTIRAAHAE